MSTPAAANGAGLGSLPRAGVADSINGRLLAMRQILPFTEPLLPIIMQGYGWKVRFIELQKQKDRGDKGHGGKNKEKHNQQSCRDRQGCQERYSGKGKERTRKDCKEDHGCGKGCRNEKDRSRPGESTRRSEGGSGYREAPRTADRPGDGEIRPGG